RVFADRMATISEEPAGSIGPEGPQTALIFSPHPDDDVISMGGTIIRLVEQGHRVHIAYMTSGNIAVFDHDALRFADFASEFNRLFGITDSQCAAASDRVQKSLKCKPRGHPDCDDVLKIKALIRQTEARAAAFACGV